MLRWMLCAAGLVLTTACATPVGSFAPGPLSSQNSSYSNGAPVLFSQATRSTIAIGPPSAIVDRSQRVQLLLLVRNTSDHPVTIGPNDVRASTETGEQLHVYTASELEREARSRAAWTQFGAAMQMMSNSMAAANAGYTSTYGTTNGTVSAYTPRGSAYGTYSGTYTGSTYDSGAAARAQMQANQQNAAIADQTRQETEAIMANSQSGAFQVQTIAPGGSYFTPVTLSRLPRGSRAILVEVTVAGELHRVDLVYTQ